MRRHNLKIWSAIRLQATSPAGARFIADEGTGRPSPRVARCPVARVSGTHATDSTVSALAIESAKTFAQAVKEHVSPQIGHR